MNARSIAMLRRITPNPPKRSISPDSLLAYEIAFLRLRPFCRFDHHADESMPSCTAPGSYKLCDEPAHFRLPLEPGLLCSNSHRTSKEGSMKSLRLLVFLMAVGAVSAFPAHAQQEVDPDHFDQSTARINDSKAHAAPQAMSAHRHSKPAHVRTASRHAGGRGHHRSRASV
jgi:hypothetical protein